MKIYIDLYRPRFMELIFDIIKIAMSLVLTKVLSLLMSSVMLLVLNWFSITYLMEKRGHVLQTT